MIYEDFQKIEIDSLGNKRIEVFDSQDRIIETKKLSPKGEELFCEQIFYDLEGNIKKKKTQDLDLEFEYDNMGRKIKEIESGKKVTSYEYDKHGHIIKKTLPSQVYLDFTSDSFDRRLSVISSDGTVNYEYRYSNLNLVEVVDKVLGRAHSTLKCNTEDK